MDESSLCSRIFSGLHFVCRVKWLKINLRITLKDFKQKKSTHSKVKHQKLTSSYCNAWGINVPGDIHSRDWNQWSNPNQENEIYSNSFAHDQNHTDKHAWELNYKLTHQAWYAISCRRRHVMKRNFWWNLFERRKSRGNCKL